MFTYLGHPVWAEMNGFSKSLARWACDTSLEALVQKILLTFCALEIPFSPCFEYVFYGEIFWHQASSCSSARRHLLALARVFHSGLQLLIMLLNADFSISRIYSLLVAIFKYIYYIMIDSQIYYLFTDNCIVTKPISLMFSLSHWENKSQKQKKCWVEFEGHTLWCSGAAPSSVPGAQQECPRQCLNPSIPTPKKNFGDKQTMGTILNSFSDVCLPSNWE